MDLWSQPVIIGGIGRTEPAFVRLTPVGQWTGPNCLGLCRRRYCQENEPSEGAEQTKPSPIIAL
jgi:hypothetical protein